MELESSLYIALPESVPYPISPSSKLAPFEKWCKKQTLALRENDFLSVFPF